MRDDAEGHNEVGVPDEYVGLTQLEKLACLHNRHRIRAEKVSVYTPTQVDLALEVAEKIEQRFKELDPERYKAGLQIIVRTLGKMETRGNRAAHDMAMIARGKLASMELEEEEDGNVE